MEIVTELSVMHARIEEFRAAGKIIGLVPTMGGFHAGHLSLMREAKARADRLVVTLFVNPIQFGPGEDLDRYPRNFEQDAALAKGQSVDLLFAPEAAAMYPGNFQTRVSVSELSRPLCGQRRPGHFDGVTTVVAKLFHICRPHLAVFGEKDFQQLAIIRRMVRDLDWQITIVGHPIVREPDGLAMSSRNAYLSPGEREQALCLSKAIRFAGQRATAGVTESDKLLPEIRSFIAAFAAVQLEYAEIVDQETLTPSKVVDQDSVLALAAKIGRTRLIDNGRLLGLYRSELTPPASGQTRLNS